MATLPNQDIQFQPKTNGYSFTTQKPKKSLNIFFVLIISAIVLFLIILGVLNYFNVFSISRNLAKIVSTPPPTFDSQSQTYSLNGTLVGYDQYMIKVKYYNQTISFKYVPEQSNFKINNGKIDFLGLFSELETEKNIGKKVNVIYSIENKVKIIKQITLFQ